ncbi:MAG TPA: TIGR03067 domain-containing protein [Gemmataceae bacterium]|nr:TIGR03067 domain-containing protein [Gemmataceae bacterium]
MGNQLMRGVICSFMIFSLCLLAAGCSRLRKGNATSDLRKLQGAWEIQKLEQDGESAADASILKMVIIQDDRFAFRYRLARSKEDGDLVYHFRLDTSKSPRQIQLTSPEEGDLAPGIYELDGDTLKICWNRNDKSSVPSDFTCAKGSDRRLIVLQRAK